MLSEEELDRRMNESIRIGTEVHSLREWLDKSGISYRGYLSRMQRGMTIKEALTTPRGKVFEALVTPKQPEPEKAKKVEYRFVRNGGGAGTYRWVEVDE